MWFNKIKSWFNKDLLDEIEEAKSREVKLLNRITDFVVAETQGDSLTLLKHQLGSVDLKDLDDKDMSEGDRREYCASISGIYPRLEKDIKKFLHEQLMFMSNNAENWDQVIFGRGTFNGLDLLLTHWKKASAEHMERLKPEEKFDKHKLLPEIED